MNYILYFIPTDGIQAIFLFITAFLSVSTALWVHLTALPQNWDKVWTNYTPKKLDDDLSIEHGSVMELAEAVELPAEKVADSLPSMLLVIGLLGTFLGVGVALDSAADVLGNTNAKPEKLLSDMLPMLDGLGALFKSSVYGIIFFFLFSLWRSKFGRVKERFNWCVVRCNMQINKNSAIASANTTRIVEAVNSLAESVGKNIYDGLKAVVEDAFNKGLDGIKSNLNYLNADVCKTLEKNVVEQFDNVEENLKKILKKIDDYRKNMSDILDKITPLMESVESLSSSVNENFGQIPDVMDVLKKSSKDFTRAASKISESAESFNPTVVQTLEMIKSQFVDSMDHCKESLCQVSSSIDNLLTTSNQEIVNIRMNVKNNYNQLKELFDSLTLNIKNSAESIQKNLASNGMPINTTLQSVDSALKILISDCEKEMVLVNEMKKILMSDRTSKVVDG